MSVIVYGASDDLIELEGDICDEFSAFDCWRYLHFGEGTIVKAGYGQVPDKGWHVEVVREGTASATVLVPKFDDGCHYTDRLELNFDNADDSEVRVECWATMEGPDDGDMETFWENFETRDFPLDKLVAAYRALKA